MQDQQYPDYRSETDWDAISFGMTVTPAADDDAGWHSIHTHGFPFSQNSMSAKLADMDREQFFALSCVPISASEESHVRSERISELRNIIRKITGSASGQIALWVCTVFERNVPYGQSGLCNGEWTKRRLFPFYSLPVICVAHDPDGNLWMKAERTLGLKCSQLIYFRDGEITVKAEWALSQKLSFKSAVLNNLARDDFLARFFVKEDVHRLLDLAVNFVVDSDHCTDVLNQFGPKENAVLANNLLYWDALRNWTGRKWMEWNKLYGAVEQRSSWARCRHSNGSSVLLGLITTPLGNNFLSVTVDWQRMRPNCMTRYMTTSLSFGSVCQLLDLCVTGNAHFRDLLYLGFDTPRITLTGCERRIGALANVLAENGVLVDGVDSQTVIARAKDRLNEMKRRVNGEENPNSIHRIGKIQIWTSCWEDHIEIRSKLSLVIVPALVSSTRKSLKIIEATFGDIRNLIYPGSEARGELPEDDVMLSSRVPEGFFDMYLDMVVHHAALFAYRARRYLKLELARRTLELDEQPVPNPLEASAWYPSPVYSLEPTTPDILARTALVLGSGALLNEDKIKEKQDELVELCSNVNWRGILDDQTKGPTCDVELFMRAICHAASESRSVWAFVCSIFLDLPAECNQQEEFNHRKRWSMDIRFPFGILKPPFSRVIRADGKWLLNFIPPIMTMIIAVTVGVIMFVLLWRTPWKSVEEVSSGITAILVFVLTIGGFFHKLFYPGWDISDALCWRIPLELTYYFADGRGKRDVAIEIIKLGVASEVFAREKTSFLGERSTQGNLILRPPLTIQDLMDSGYKTGYSGGKEALCHEDLLLIEDSPHGSDIIRYRPKACMITGREPPNPSKSVF